jgi:hypothetical protein
MSNYSMAFDRLRRDSATGARATAEPLAEAPELAPKAPGPTQEAAALAPEGSVGAQTVSGQPATEGQGVAGWRTEQLRSVEQRESYGALLDTIRSLRQVRGTAPFVVLSGASRAEAVDRVVGGLVAIGLRRGIRVIALELVATPDGRQIRAHRVSGLDPGQVGPLEITGPRSRDDIEAWLRGAVGRFDVVAVEAPSLADSADGALLGRDLDGLFVVAEQGRTRANQLKVAAQRARSAASTVHGLVLTESRGFLPSWLARILGADDL